MTRLPLALYYAETLARTKAGKPRQIRPILAKIKLTETCDMRCQMCDHWRVEDTTKELTDDEIGRLIDRLGELGYRFVRFTGGEPTLRDALPALVARAAAAGMHTSMVSNGQRIDDTLAATLAGAGLASASISINGIGARHDRIFRKPGAFAGVERAVAALARAGVAVGGNLTIMESTLDDIPEVIAWAVERRVPLSFNLLDLHSYFFDVADGAKRRLAVADLERIDRLVEELRSAQRQHPRVVAVSETSLRFLADYFRDPHQAAVKCVSSVTSTYFDALGNVYGGCWVLGPVGNLRQADLAEILGTESFGDRKEEMFHKRCPGCSCGYARSLLFHSPGREIAAQARRRLGLLAKL